MRYAQPFHRVRAEPRTPTMGGARGAPEDKD